MSEQAELFETEQEPTPVGWLGPVNQFVPHEIYAKCLKSNREFFEQFEPVYRKGDATS